MEPTTIDYSAVLADLKDKRDKLNTAIAAIEQFVFGRAASDTDLGGETPMSADASREILRIEGDTFFGLSTTEAARKYLRMKKRPASTQEIADALQEGGYLTNSKNFYSNVFGSLRRMSDFVNVQQKWGLVEWYPGRRLDKLKAGPIRPDEAEPEVDAAADEEKQDAG